MRGRRARAPSCSPAHAPRCACVLAALAPGSPPTGSRWGASAPSVPFGRVRGRLCMLRLHQAQWTRAVRRPVRFPPPTPPSTTPSTSEVTSETASAGPRAALFAALLRSCGLAVRASASPWRRRRAELEGYRRDAQPARRGPRPPPRAAPPPVRSFLKRRWTRTRRLVLRGAVFPSSVGGACVDGPAASRCGARGGRPPENTPLAHPSQAEHT